MLDMTFLFFFVLFLLECFIKEGEGKLLACARTIVQNNTLAFELPFKEDVKEVSFSLTVQDKRAHPTLSISYRRHQTPCEAYQHPLHNP
mmetsp:Transcript_22127/g.39147  ORF Transcript_22127/g.39147 Transcript_22127/m.39147 type:complete len:89 (+) Transcript_22127:105-371(+)